jgi:transaldolase / glucose-6-phosphate isomerase
MGAKMTKLHELHQLGQSVWLDYIRRQFIEDGGLQAAVDQGVRGITSNPSIFEKAIGSSSDYDEQMKELVAEGKTADEIYEALAIADIQAAADILQPIYEESNGEDGYVSLEVSPTLAYKTDATIADARRLHAAVNRPNLMVKVPATAEGVPAVRQLIGEGININVTLMFSLQDYDNIAEAYISGLETLAEKGGDLKQVASVASFFVSRVDSDIDAALEKVGNKELQGKIAVANAKAAYAHFQKAFSGTRWEALAAKGARVQRPLWASTSTKNPAYSPTLYVDELIGEHTVNTMPPETIEAFGESGTVATTITEGVHEAFRQIHSLKQIAVDYDAITLNLQTVGVQKFAQSFESLMKSVRQKREKLLAEKSRIEVSLGSYKSAFEQATAELRANNILRRIWEKDHTVWQESPVEIDNRLGWLTIMDNMQADVSRMEHLAKQVQEDGYTNALLLGMGGSSLAPEVFSITFGAQTNGLKLQVLDSTDPAAVLAFAKSLDVAKTLFIVSTKSGTTPETLSAFKYFYNKTLKTLGTREEAGKHFVAITDPKSQLESLAERYLFRSIFLNDPNIGGRYSVLSYFGLVPAALIGVDVRKLLSRAQDMAFNCRSDNCPSEGDNNGGRIGALIATLAKLGRDKLTFILSPAIESFGDWAEQLIAESTGKKGVGIAPIVGEELGAPSAYGNDRLFVYIRLDDTHDAAVEALKAAGQPVVTIHLRDKYDLGGQFFLWEMATAVAGHILNIQPFDQPNVEAAKILARGKIEEYQKTGKLQDLAPRFSRDGIAVMGDIDASSPAEALRKFLAHAQDGAYIAVHAYIPMNAQNMNLLKAFQKALRDKTKRATTVGFGPRFLHSTGQLHKGDAGKGLFIQLTNSISEDAPIPDEAGEDSSAMSFGTLKTAQALGDREALLEARRPVIRFHLQNVQDGLRQLINSL